MTITEYAGILAGQALVGFVVRLTCLPVACNGVVVLLLIVAASARSVPH